MQRDAYLMLVHLKPSMLCMASSSYIRLGQTGAKEGPCLACRMLCEVHESYETNIALAKKGYWVYDFALPLLILHAFTFHTAKNLRRWMQICPKCQITVLDTHDGMVRVVFLSSLLCVPVNGSWRTAWARTVLVSPPPLLQNLVSSCIPRQSRSGCWPGSQKFIGQSKLVIALLVHCHLISWAHEMQVQVQV